MCEGPADEAFIRAIMNYKGIHKDFHIRNTSDRKTQDMITTGGIDFIGEVLQAFTTFRGFEIIKHVVIVVDNDENPNANFLKVCSQISGIKSLSPTVERKYAVPKEPYKRAKGDIDVTIITVPDKECIGNLETLCLPAARTAAVNITDCLSQYATCTGADKWKNKTKYDKMLLRSLLAASHQQNPAIGIGKIWNEAPHLIPLSDPSLKKIINIISSQVA